MATNLKKVELRATDTNKFSTDESNGLNVGGYVNQTGTKSDLLQDFDGTDFYEVIQPGVFTRALETGNFVDFYYEHDPSKCLASTQDDSLQLKEDNIGLKMSATIVPTTFGNDAYEMIKYNRTAGMSFGFIVTGENWDTSGDVPIRTITALQLFEVSAVRFPAYPASDIQARSKKVNSLNKVLEKRGMRLNSIQLSKKEDRSMADSGVTSNDMNNLISAINSLQKSVDNQTDCISSSFSSLLTGLGNEETDSKNPKSKEKRGKDDPEKDKSSDKKDKEAKEEERKKQAAKEKEAKEKRSSASKKLEALNNMIK